MFGVVTRTIHFLTPTYIFFSFAWMQITESLKGNFSPTIYEHCLVFGFSYSSLNIRKLFLFFFSVEGVGKP